MVKTEIWRPEDAQVYIYEHVEREDTTGTVDGTGSSFVMSKSPSAIVGQYWDADGSALPQFVDGNGAQARRDIDVYKYLNGAYTLWDTTSDGSIVIMAGSELVFETAPTTAQASKIAAGLHSNGIEVEDQREIIAMIAYLQRLGTDITK